MSKGLSNLSKTVPPHPEVEKIMSDLRKEKDISVAIVASAIIEAYLERAITAKLKVSSKALTERLFDNQGPLGTFSGKIDIAQAFGVITSPMAVEMHIIREIRNAFAHSKLPISFDDQAVAAKTNSLKLLVNIQRLASVPSGRKAFAETNKHKFLLVTQVILIMLHIFEEEPGTANEVLEEALADKTT